MSNPGMRCPFSGMPCECNIEDMNCALDKEPTEDAWAWANNLATDDFFAFDVYAGLNDG